jgi:hypothetical protein
VSTKTELSHPLKFGASRQPFELALLAISLLKVHADHDPTASVAELDFVNNLNDLNQSAIHLCYYGHLLLLAMYLL